MKLYAVTKGEYSDYHIDALTTNRARAEFVAKKCSDKWNDAEVEEYEDREVVERPLWRVLIKDRKRYPSMLSYEDQFTFTGDINRVYETNRESNTYCIYVEANNEAHALKTASDIFAQYCYEHDIDLRRDDYSAPMVSASDLFIGKWLDTGDGYAICSRCGYAIRRFDIFCFCKECLAVMNAKKFYEVVSGRG